MSIRTWLLLLIFSLTCSCEVILWAAVHGQFRNAHRGRFLPLREVASPPPVPRPRELARIVAGLGLFTLVWGRLALHLLKAAF